MFSKTYLDGHHSGLIKALESGPSFTGNLWLKSALRSNHSVPVAIPEIQN